MNRRTVLKSLGACVLAQVLPSNKLVDASDLTWAPASGRVEWLEFRVYDNKRELLLAHPIRTEMSTREGVFAFWGPYGLELTVNGPANVDWVGIQAPKGLRNMGVEEMTDPITWVDFPIILEPGAKLTLQIPSKLITVR